MSCRGGGNLRDIGINLGVPIKKTQHAQLTELSFVTNRSINSLLREAVDLLLTKYKGYLPNSLKMLEEIERLTDDDIMDIEDE